MPAPAPAPAAADAVKHEPGTFGALGLWDIAKMVLMTAISVMCLLYLTYGIMQGHSVVPLEPLSVLLLFVFVVWLLGMLEGLQIALLELDAAEMASVRFFFPGVWACHVATLGQGMSDWLAGRQVLVIVAVFICAQLTTFPTLDAIYGVPLPAWFDVAVVKTGLPGALIVVAIGQLVPQLVATSHPLRVMRAPLAWPVVRLSLLLQKLGVSHFAWALTVWADRALRRCEQRRRAVRKARPRRETEAEGEGFVDVEAGAGDEGVPPRAASAATPQPKPPPVAALGTDPVEEPREVEMESGAIAALKYVLVTALSLFCALIIFYGMASGHARFPGPPWLHVLLFLFMVTLLGHLEGLQVALLRFEAIYDAEAFRESHPHVYRSVQATKGSEQMNDFLCGRQVCVILSAFMVAQLTTFSSLTSLPLLGELPGWFKNAFFWTGLPGALVVVAIGQLVPQLIAELHPLALLKQPLSPYVVKAALALQRLGLTHFAVLVAMLAKRALNLDSTNASNVEHDAEAASEAGAGGGGGAQLPPNAHNGVATAGNRSQRDRRAGGRYTALVEEATRRDMAAFAQQFLSQQSQVVKDAIYAIQPTIAREVTDAADFPLLVTLEEAEIQDVDVPLDVSTTLKPASGKDLLSGLDSDALSLGERAQDVGEIDSTVVAPRPPDWATNNKKYGRTFKTPENLATDYAARYGAVPRFLLPPDHEKHIPPHIVAHELLSALGVSTRLGAIEIPREPLVGGGGKKSKAGGARPGLPSPSRGRPSAVVKSRSRENISKISREGGGGGLSFGLSKSRSTVRIAAAAAAAAPPSGEGGGAGV